MMIQSEKDRMNLRMWAQRLVLFPGPSEGNALSGDEERARRTAELMDLITAGTPGCTLWCAKIAEVFKAPLSQLSTDVGKGAQRGVFMPTICIDMIGTVFGHGPSGRVNETKQPHAVALCQALIGILGAHWCDSWYMGNFHGFRVKCGADGTVEP
jgi:hypothetical protein